MKRIKLYYILRVLLSALVMSFLGGVVLWSEAYAVEIFDILLIATGILGTLLHLPDLVLSMRAVITKKRWEWITLISALISIGFGVCFMLIQRTAPILPLLLILYVTVLPLIKMLLVSDRIKQFQLELPKIFFVTFLLVVTVTQTEDRMLFVLGIALIVIAVLYAVLHLLRMPKVCKPYTEKFDQ